MINTYQNDATNYNENQKILIHDIRKHLFSIAELYRLGKNDKITEYISQLIDYNNLQSPMQVCDNQLLNAIIHNVKKQCENNTAIITDIRSCCLDFIKECDITSLFCNLLDNALEASSKTEKSFIELSVRNHSSNDNDIIIIMVNSCQTNPFINNKLVSTKTDSSHHGYGMKSIQNVVNKYNGMSHFYFESETNTFHSVIVLKKL